MATKLNRKAYEYAKNLILHGEIDHDSEIGRKNWKTNEPTDDQKVKELNTHDIEEYGQWFLGINDDIKEDSKEKYKYAYGDFAVVHESLLKHIKKEATKNGDHEIEKAAEELLNIIEH